MKDTVNFMLPVVALAPQVQTNASGALVGAIIDRQGYDSLAFLIALGAVTDANVTAAVLIEEGNDPALADAAAVADADLIGTEVGASFNFADDNETRKIGYNGRKRYVRLTVTSAGNDVGSLPIAAIAVLGNGGQMPYTSQG